MSTAHGAPLPGAGEPIDEAGMAELEGLVGRTGWPAARRLVEAVCGIDRRDQLHRMTKRELATLRIALAVLAQSLEA